MLYYKNIVQILKHLKRLGLGKYIVKDFIDLAWEEAFFDEKKDVS